jgi:hypothetical protein
LLKWQQLVQKSTTDVAEVNAEVAGSQFMLRTIQNRPAQFERRKVGMITMGIVAEAWRIQCRALCVARGHMAHQSDTSAINFGRAYFGLPTVGMG